MMGLTGEQLKTLRQGLGRGFRNVNDLNMFLVEQVEKDINDYASIYDPLPHVAFKLIQAADAEGWIDRLVMAAQATRPNQSAFADVATALGLTAAGPNLSNDRPLSGAPVLSPQSHLESIVKGTERFEDIEVFLTKASRLQSQICRIETTNPDGNGTGFLVAPDLMLTNYHVMEPVMKSLIRAEDIVCRFDYRKAADGVTVRTGTEFKVKASDWNVDSSKYSQADATSDGASPADNELDYCLVRLDEAAGQGKAGGSNDQNAEDRGWIPLNRNQDAGSARQDIFIIHHPQGRPLKMAIGEHLGFNGASNRMRYDADTLEGSSGSPVFNADLDLIGLHHRGDPAANAIAMTAEHNQGIPISNIVASIEANGVEKFWEL